MADTSYLKHVVEDYVRRELEREYAIPFASRVLRLRPGGTHEFDAVSLDGRVAGSIKTAGGRTASGKAPAGKMKDCEAELYYLTLVEAPSRQLILTSPSFYTLMANRLAGRLENGIQLRLIRLPRDMQEQVEAVQRKASDEMVGR